MLLFVGTYTLKAGHLQGDPNTGIPIYDFCQSTGKLIKSGTLDNIDNPSFLNYHGSEEILLSVSETSEFGEQPGGGLIICRQTQDSSEWETIGKTVTGGESPCHVTLSPDGNFAFVTNYNGGSLTMMDIRNVKDPQICHQVQHKGNSIHPARQTRPHPHSSLIDPSGDFLFVADLGIDQIRIYRIDYREKSIIPSDPASINLEAGAGPRHMAYHPGNSVLYVLNELNSTITSVHCSYPFDELSLIGTVSALEATTSDRPGAAEITLHKGGRFLYASNRADNSIMLFEIDTVSGLPIFKSRFSSGKTPRHFAISPNGRWLISAHQDEGTLQVWSIDTETGYLARQGEPSPENAPVCVCFGHA